MGSLAAEKPEHGKPLSGILIKRGFNYHLIAPDDLQSKFVNLSMTELFFLQLLQCLAENLEDGVLECHFP